MVEILETFFKLAAGMLALKDLSYLIPLYFELKDLMESLEASLLSKLSLVKWFPKPLLACFLRAFKPLIFFFLR